MRITIKRVNKYTAKSDTFRDGTMTDTKIRLNRNWMRIFALERKTCRGHIRTDCYGAHIGHAETLTFQWAAIERRSRRLSSIVCQVHWCHCWPHWPIAVVAMVMAPVKLNCCSANPNGLTRSIGESIWRDFDAMHRCCLYYLQIDYGVARAHRCRRHHYSLHVRLVYAISSHLVCLCLCSARNCCALDFVRSLRVTEENRFENEIN